MSVDKSLGFDPFSTDSGRRKRGRQPGKGMEELYDDNGMPTEQISERMTYEELFAEVFTKSVDSHHHKEKLYVTLPPWLYAKLQGYAQNDPRYKVAGHGSPSAVVRDALYKLFYIEDGKGSLLAREIRQQMDIDEARARTVERRERYEAAKDKIADFEGVVVGYLESEEWGLAAAEVADFERVIPDIDSVSEKLGREAAILLRKVDGEAYGKYGERWLEARGPINR